MGKRWLFRVMIVVGVITTLAACEAGKLGNLTNPMMEKSVKKNVYLGSENVGGMRQSELLQKLKEYEKEVNREPNDAKFDTASWEMIQREIPGKKLDIQKTIELLLSADKGNNVNIVFQDVMPSKSYQQVQNGIVLLASYTSPILDDQESRVNNIQVGAAKLNFKKLSPGEEFSFNRTLGKRTEAKGYEEAPIIVKTQDGYKKGKGVGGGICQLASTLYNAVEKAGLQVTERHEHTKDVGYVPDGKDATVSYGSVDFKFINNRNYPIMIKTYANNKSLTVKILENRN